MITLYIVLNYKDTEGNRSNWALLDKDDAETWNEEGDGDGVIEVQSEEIGWMKQAADAACQFHEWSDTGSLELSTLFHNIEEYEKEIFYR
jgi:hypothetical protein